MDQSTTRRAMLGAAVALPIAALLPASAVGTGASLWEQRLALVRLRAQAQIGADDRAFGRLARSTDRALRDLLRTPAPTLSAVAVKFDLWREHDCVDGSDGFSLDPIFADVRRLA